MNKNIQLLVGALALIAIGGVIFLVTPQKDSQITSGAANRPNSQKNDIKKPGSSTPGSLAKAAQEGSKMSSRPGYKCDAGKTIILNLPSITSTDKPTITLNNGTTERTYTLTSKVTSSNQPSLVDVKNNIVVTSKQNYVTVTIDGKVSYDKCQLDPR